VRRKKGTLPILDGLRLKRLQTRAPFPPERASSGEGRVGKCSERDERAPFRAVQLFSQRSYGHISFGKPKCNSVSTATMNASPAMYAYDFGDDWPFDIEAIVSDTAGSALTGRHQPAAREYSHLFGLSRVRMHLLSAWFQRGTGDS